MGLTGKVGGLLIGSAALAWAVACGSSSSTVASKSNNCPVGSEGCPCTAGGGCDKGLVCYDPLCFKPGAEGTGGSRAGGTGGQGGVDTISGRPDSGISGIATGGVPIGGAAGTGGATSSTGGSGGPDGSVGTGGTDNSKPASCPFPVDKATAHKQSDPNNSTKDPVAAKFTRGRLVELDGKTCTQDAAVTPTGDWGSYQCRDGYSCGGCAVFVMSPSDATAVGNWYLVGEYSATNGTSLGCPELSGAYLICVPDCAGKQCGDDGCGSFCGVGCGTGNCCTSANQCVEDTCSRCLDACNDACGGLPGCSCCTGTGCVCQGACPGPC